MNLFIENCTTDSHQPVPNQFRLSIGGMLIFQSYRTMLCIKYLGKVYLKKDAFYLSNTTSRYLREFLNVTDTTKKFLKSIEDDPDYVWVDNFDNLQITAKFDTETVDTGAVQD